ncbi:ATP-binding protein [Thermodesulforhabdus norvegica]|uniref:histidine kinase n=1 Tax=Thermodesulforhabdus norvegica TaxID=39841 RepID=A0A1I4TXL7_9BACT|nr:ATP-binding protein [Thermodesulforhabdus norvegica]SFM81492.1 PAS domain S-box-containing protein [Thermodesulforhabdus norvegica]
MKWTITRKLISFCLVVSLVPLIILGIFTVHSIRKIGEQAAVSSSRELEIKIRESLELRAIELANRVSEFLRACEADLHTLELLPRDPEVYRQFSLNKRGIVWTRVGTNENFKEVHLSIPLYREVAFIDPQGNEVIKIRNDQVVPFDELRNVRDPANTEYGVETYFVEAAELPAGEIYVSHVTGWYVTRDEQLMGVSSVEEAIEGKKYEGVVRFASPIRGDDGHLQGVVVLSLDHQHLMEFTQHVLPTEERFVVFPSYNSGNYAFMFDDEGWIITHPKFWDIRGIKPDGSFFDPTSPDYERMVRTGLAPFNLDHVHFIHPNYAFIAEQVRKGRSGVTNTFNVGGIPRVMAYAPIFYNRGPYRKHGIFGGITIGIRTEKFNEPAEKTGRQIELIVGVMKKNQIVVLLFAVVSAIIGALILSRRLTLPLVRLTDEVRRLARGEPPLRKEPMKTGDETEILWERFLEMTSEIARHHRELRETLDELAKSRREISRYSRRLERQVTILKRINELSQYLGATLDPQLVLQKVLETVVQGIGFDRSILYLYDAETDSLKCFGTVGFSHHEETLARRGVYRVGVHDCTPVRVFRESRTLYIGGVNSDPMATELDKKIASIAGINHYVFTPLIAEGKGIGVLGADNARSGRIITEQDIESLEILAGVASRAIERSTLYGKILEERNFIRAVFTQMIHGLITMDTEGIITSVNDRAADLFRMKAEDVVGRHYNEVLSNHEALCRRIQRFLLCNTDKQSFEIEMHEDGNGVERYLDVQFSRICRDVDSDIILMFLRDVTERKKLEEHIQRSNRLVSLGTLAAGIAHEIRNPLTGLSLLLDDIHDHLESNPSTRDSAALVRKALHELDRLEELVDNLVQFAAQKGRNRPVKADLRPVIDRLVFFIRKHCKQQKIDLTVSVPDSLPEVVMDPNRIQQALLNLTLNALQAMPNGGRLTIALKTVKPFETVTGRECVRISVADTGMGIQPEDLPFIFDPFFTRHFSGTGLGLSIVHSIIVEHGGWIGVNSRPGEGTMFTVDLPVDGKAG